MLDRMEGCPEADLQRELGATYPSGSVKNIGFEPDAILKRVGQVTNDIWKHSSFSHRLNRFKPG